MWTVKKITLIALGLLIGIVFVSLSGKMYEEVGAGEICVIQHPISGEFDIYTAPGTYAQYFGTVTHYKKRSTFWFSKHENQGSTADQSIKIRFNDGGHAQVSGSVSVELPTDKESIVLFHTKYGSDEAIQHDLIETVIQKALYMTGPLMSSKESNAKKRNDLIQFIEDQAEHGVYKTIQADVKELDPLTGAEKLVTKVDIQKDKTGIAARQEQSPIQIYNIKLSNLSINSIDYDANVEKQISSQQKLEMEVQTAIANAKKSEQDAITVEQKGKADAAKAKWEQEVLKATAVTAAQQEKEVATLEVQTAELNKRKTILDGEGEAAAKRLAIGANNMLEARLAAYVEVNKAWASAVTGSNWVPSTIIGGGSGTSGSAYAPNTLMQLMMVNSAKQLGFDPLPSTQSK
jgi:hypothetical protein